MSHFALLAVRKAGNTVSYEEAMERYNESRTVTPYIYQTYEELAKAGRESIASTAYEDEAKIRDIDAGMKKSDWCEKYKEKYFNKSHAENKYEYLKKIIPLTKKYLDGTLTDKECHDFEIMNKDASMIDEEGNLLTEYNPESKWDWYSIGGRWSGELIIKKSKRSKYDGRETVDEALKGDIDWAAMNRITKEEGEHARRFWKYYVLGETYPGTKEEMEKEFGYCFYKPEYYLERYKTIEGYLKSLNTWCLRAVLDDDGELHEAGHMGWFGCSSESDEEWIKWEQEFYEKYIEPLPDDTMLTVIDCHI